MKTITGYTPGPWKPQKGYVYGADDKPVCSGFRHIPVRYNNAKLIALAPELYEENKKLREALEKIKTTSMETSAAYEIASAALKMTP